MQQKSNRLKGYFTAYIMAFSAIFLTVCMVQYPDVSFEAAAQGLQVWFEIVFPALLPFFIAGQILMGLGVVHFLGILLEPFMRPIFNIPGAGAFVMAMGLASGYPVGAALTAELRRKGLVSRTEAERLMSFSNTADPLFMFGAVAVGMFGLAPVGVTISLSHYISTVMVGLLLRFYGRQEDLLSPPVTKQERQQGNIMTRALKALYQARVKDGRPFGQLMGDSIRQSVNTLLLVGGFIILFSVVIRVATIVGLTGVLGHFIARLLIPFGLQPSLAEACISGLFEVTIGCNLASTAANSAGPGLAPLIQRVAIASGIISWSGISVHCQVAAVVNDTDIRMTPFVLARFLHGILSTIVAIFLFQYGAPVLANLALPVFTRAATLPVWAYPIVRFRYIGTGIGGILLFLCLISTANNFVSRIHFIPLWFRKGD
ncbi:MAG: sporulation integral membrane protein YlbJ [bacterium]